MIRSIINGTNVLVKEPAREDLNFVHLLADRGDGNCIRRAFNQMKAKETKILVNARTKRGETPLFIAATKGSLSAVKTLLRYGAEIEAVDNEGKTPLWSSASNGRALVTEELAKKKADVNRKVGKLRMNPLHISTAGGHYLTVKLLLDCKAKLDEKTAEGETEFFIACKTGNLIIAEELDRRGADVRTKDGRGWNALMAAAANGHDNVVRYLMYIGLDKDEKTPKGEKASDLALAENHVRTAKIVSGQR